jgi:RES domain-containing protein
MRTIRRAGEYLRIADPGWADHLDGRYARDRGGRWNAPGSFPVVYLNGSVDVARANLYKRLADQPYGPEDLDPEHAPLLVSTQVRLALFADVITSRGCESAGLPATYPRDRRGREVSWARCQPIGQAAWGAGLAGVACRTAARTAPPGGEELAWFQRGRRRLRPKRSLTFEEWFW